MKLDSSERAALMVLAPMLRARERLDFINDVSNIFGNDVDIAREHRESLVKIAYADDLDTMSDILMKLSAGG